MSVPEQLPRTLIIQPIKEKRRGNPVCINGCDICFLMDSRKYGDFKSLADWETKMSEPWISENFDQIIITGTEPTLWGKDLFRFLEFIKTRYPHMILGLYSTFRRMGAQLDGKIYTKELVSLIDWAQTTLNSCYPQIHDRTQNRNGAFDQTVSGIRNALECHLDLITNTVISDLNQDHLGPTINFIANLGVTLAYVGFLLPYGKGADYTLTHHIDYAQAYKSLYTPVPDPSPNHIKVILHGIDTQNLHPTPTLGPDWEFLKNDISGETIPFPY